MQDKDKDFIREIKGEFKELGTKVNRFFDEFVRGDGSKNSFKALADVYEEDGFLVFLVDVPGFKKEDIRVNIRENNLIIRGSRVRGHEFNEDKYHVSERGFGAFERTFSLPASVDTDGIKASFDEGTLRVTLPMIEYEYHSDAVEIE